MLEDRLERLEMDMEEERQANCCLLCGTNARDVVLFPCTHFLYCHECVTMATKSCMQCSSIVSGFLRVKLE